MSRPFQARRIQSADHMELECRNANLDEHSRMKSRSTRRPGENAARKLRLDECRADDGISGTSAGHRVVSRRLLGTGLAERSSHRIVRRAKTRKKNPREEKKREEARRRTCSRVCQLGMFARGSGRIPTNVSAISA